MPMRLPGPETIRRRIAQLAADVSAAPVEHYLGLLGPVEATAVVDMREAPWRLSYYQGSRQEHDAIERAIGAVQRTDPLMRVQ